MLPHVTVNQILAKDFRVAVPVSCRQRQRVFPDGLFDAFGRILEHCGIGAGEDQVPEVVAQCQAGFEDVEQALDVDVEVLLRRERPPGLERGAEVEDRIPSRRRGHDVVAGAEVALNDLGAYPVHVLGHPVAGPDEAPDVVAVLDEPARDVGADATGDSGHQDLQFRAPERWTTAGIRRQGGNRTESYTSRRDAILAPRHGG